MKVTRTDRVGDRETTVVVEFSEDGFMKDVPIDGVAQYIGLLMDAATNNETVYTPSTPSVEDIRVK